RSSRLSQLPIVAAARQRLHLQWSNWARCPVWRGGSWRIELPYPRFQAPRSRLPLEPHRRQFSDPAPELVLSPKGSEKVPRRNRPETCLPREPEGIAPSRSQTSQAAASFLAVPSSIAPRSAVPGPSPPRRALAERATERVSRLRYLMPAP